MLAFAYAAAAFTIATMTMRAGNREITPGGRLSDTAAFIISAGLLLTLALLLMATCFAIQGV